MKLLFCGYLILMFPAILMARQDTTYQQQMAAFYKLRKEVLLAQDGWINLSGLFWLQPGINHFGSKAGNDLVFDHPDFPERAGTFDWKDGKVTWTSQPGVAINSNGQKFEKGLVFDPVQPRAPQLAFGSFRWNIIKREDKIGVRFRNFRSENLKRFQLKGIDHFPIDTVWRMQAKLSRGSQNLIINNVLGQTFSQESPGKLTFLIHGVSYQLDALEEDGQLFIVFGDATSGKETYAAGRFLYAPMPDKNGITLLDFNQAINPPCAFSPYATCPLPPAQNILPVAIPAGEKDFSFDKH